MSLTQLVVQALQRELDRLNLGRSRCKEVKRVPIACDDGTRPSIFSDEQGLAGAFHSTQRIEGLTHRFYRYPARFSHEFVRHVIDELSEPGDTDLTPSWAEEPPSLKP